MAEFPRKEDQTEVPHAILARWDIKDLPIFACKAFHEKFEKHAGMLQAKA